MEDNARKEICGIVMPISSIDGCSESHWLDVREILIQAIEDAGFEANLVSNGDDSGIIHKRIIQNLYDNPIVVCDVSGKNPNVMFELGLRLAFDKPTVIVKDENTSYSFDTSAIEHIEYPRDLRFARMVEFKQKLCDKIKATHLRATSDENYTTFLKHFGEFKVAKLDKKEISGQEFILEELRGIRHAVRKLEVSSTMSDSNYHSESPATNTDLNICMENWPEAKIDELISRMKSHPAILAVRKAKTGSGHYHAHALVKAGNDLSEVRSSLGIPGTSKRLLRSRPGNQGLG